MKTSKLKTLTIQTVAFGLVISLQACGGGDNGTATPVATGIPGVNGISATDVVAANVIPQLQNTYGNINVVNQVTMQTGLTYGAGQHSWADFYGFFTSFVQQEATSCVTANVPNVTYWQTINYQCLAQVMNASQINIQIMEQAPIYFSNPGYSNSASNLYVPFNILFNAESQQGSAGGINAQYGYNTGYTPYTLPYQYGNYNYGAGTAFYGSGSGLNVNFSGFLH